MGRLLTILLLSVCGCASAQQFQYSQYNYTPQRLNPALVSSGNYMLGSFSFRNQTTGGGFSLTSNALNVSYPFINSKGQRWSGVGISLVDDRSGFEGIYSTQEVALSYAVTKPIVRFHTITLGLKGSYVSQSIDLDKLLTGSQYVSDRGLDPSIDNGESGSRWRENDFTVSAGLYWQNTDKKGSKLSYAGFSFYDFNKSSTRTERAGQLNSGFVFMAGQRAWQKDKITLFPEVLYATTATNHLLNAGLISSYELKTFSKEMPERVDLVTKYMVGKWITLGIQLHRRNFSFGASYDFPAGKENVANLGAFEIGLEWKKLTQPLKSKKKKKKRTPPEKQTGEQLPLKQLETEEEVPEDKEESSPQKSHQGTLSEKLRHKRDSVDARANAGELENEPLILDKATLHFNFEFNSTGIGKDTQAYLDDLAQALIDNAELNIRLEGHTDNVGSDKFNLKLSVERARAMKEYLEKKGVESDRIVVEGKGEREPLNNNATPAEQSLNRRVELTVFYGN